MKYLPMILKTITLCLLTFAPKAVNAKEIVVSTHEGESFYFQLDMHTTLAELTQKVSELSLTKEDRVILELPLKEENPFDPIVWGYEVKRHGQYLGYPRNYYTELTTNERADIHYIITFLANKSLISIASHKGTLEEKGDHIDHVHPLRFLHTVFTDEELKVGIRNIRAKGWIWGDFIAGLKESLSTEANLYNITDDQLYHLARSVEIDPNLILPVAAARRWDELIDTLITYVPRKGDYNRFDS